MMTSIDYLCSVDYSGEQIDPPCAFKILEKNIRAVVYGVLLFLHLFASPSERASLTRKKNTLD